MYRIATSLYCVGRNKLKYFILLLIALVFFFYSILSTEPELFQSENVNLIKIPGNANAEIERNRKWIVLTGINHPSTHEYEHEQLRKWSNVLPGWTLLVVDDKEEFDCEECPNQIIYLSPSNQKNLKYRIIQFLPRTRTRNSYVHVLKMIGYLFAIEHGAEFIYDADFDQSMLPTDLDKSFEFEKTTRGLLLNGNNTVTVNPFVHFGQPSLFPRGFPIEDIGQKYNHTYTVCGRIYTPLIQHGIVNGNPDLDPMSQLLTRQTDQNQIIQFDASAPPLILEKLLLAPFNSKSTLFHYDSFWSMILPVSINFEIADIWRGYWSQPLLWLIDSRLGFYLLDMPAKTQNIFKKQTSFEFENKFYNDLKNLTRLLQGWKCSEDDLYNCMTNLTSTLVAHHFWSEVEIKFLEAWISDLKMIGYKKPEIITPPPRKSCIIEKSPTTWSRFIPIQQKSKIQRKQENMRAGLREFCNFTIPTNSKNFNPIQFPSVLLIVTYNHPHFENVWFYDQIYRPHFPNMIYCGDMQNSNELTKVDEMEEFEELSKSKNGFSFVHANVTDGFLIYECALRVIEMNYGRKITGYLVLSDDLVHKFWQNVNFDPNEVWWWASDSKKNAIFNTDNVTRDGHWQIWISPFGLKGTRAALTKIYDQNAIAPVQEFRRRSESYGWNSTMARFGIGDIFYIPRAKSEMFYQVGKIYREHDVFLEIALPMILAGLSSPSETVNLELLHPPNLKLFNGSFNCAHQVKFFRILGDLNLRKDYCTFYVKDVLAAGSFGQMWKNRSNERERKVFTDIFHQPQALVI